jgi:hypothetical protein
MFQLTTSGYYDTEALKSPYPQEVPSFGATLEQSFVPKELADVHKTLIGIAKERQDDCGGLLELLRFLETLHGQIRDDYYVSSLPQNRGELYALLKEMEDRDGWPLLPRTETRSLLRWLDSARDGEAL